VEKSKDGWRAHIHIGHRINAEVNDVKAGRGKYHGFGDWTRVFTWWISGEKVGKLQTTFLQPDIINATIYPMVYVRHFSRSMFSIMIMEFPIKEILPHGEIVLQR
jgi:hypothetical protein